MSHFLAQHRRRGADTRTLSTEKRLPPPIRLIKAKLARYLAWDEDLRPWCRSRPRPRGFWIFIRTRWEENTSIRLQFRPTPKEDAPRVGYRKSPDYFCEFVIFCHVIELSKRSASDWLRRERSEMQSYSGCLQKTIKSQADTSFVSPSPDLSQDARTKHFAKFVWLWGTWSSLWSMPRIVCSQRAEKVIFACRWLNHN